MTNYNLDIISLQNDSLEFQKLHSKFLRFNPFKILKVDKFEIRHSNVLAWLLDPKENHNLETYFIKNLLTKAYLKEENEGLRPTDMMWMHKLFVHDLEVQREVPTKKDKRIDLLAISESQKLVLLIENKYKSGESEGQLNEYLTFVNAKYPEYHVVPIFLTLDNSEPSNNKYLQLGYSDVLDILKVFIHVKGDQTFSPIKEFINYYIAILEDELVQDEEDIELALQIYKEYKDAVDYLIYLGTSRTDKYMNHDVKAAADFLGFEDKKIVKKTYESHKDTIDFIYKMGNNLIRDAFIDFAYQNEISDLYRRDHVKLPSFILPKWRKLDEVVGVPRQPWWLNNTFIVWFERLWDNKLKLTIEVGPIKHDERVLVLNTLESKGAAIKASAKEEGKKFTKIYTSAIQLSVSDWADKPKIIDAMNDLYQREDFNRILTIISRTIDELVDGESSEEEEVSAQEESVGVPKTIAFQTLTASFSRFIEPLQIDHTNYKIQTKKPHFILPEFRKLEETFGVPQWKWWLNNCVIMWFEKLTDNRLKFSLEVGPLEVEKRLAFLNRLEEKGLRIKNQAKRPEASFTKIASDTLMIQNWENEEEVLEGMKKLYDSSECQRVINIIREIAAEL
jgi:hypothetical protein